MREQAAKETTNLWVIFMPDYSTQGKAVARSLKGELLPLVFPSIGLHCH